SEDMLAAARNPVMADKISIPRIELIRGNAHLTSFPTSSFDFIYSLGMFGNGCPVTVEVCDRFYAWLKPGGKLFFNVVDVAGLPISHRTRRRLRAMIYPRLTRKLQRLLDEREQRSPFFSLTKAELLNLLSLTRFTNFEVTSHPCQSPLWNGRHLECLATRSP
ncbi:MAG TPA: class I SAM-dependent methyltransferase, partial [Clostridia bacterium]|nr:class I SAM-dependent methyltransferase [Clostridia bacterium]